MFFKKIKNNNKKRKTVTFKKQVAQEQLHYGDPICAKRKGMSRKGPQERYQHWGGQWHWELGGAGKFLTFCTLLYCFKFYKAGCFQYKKIKK